MKITGTLFLATLFCVTWEKIHWNVGADVSAFLMTDTYPYHGNAVAASRSLAQFGITSLSTWDELPYQSTTSEPASPATAHRKTFEFASFPFTRMIGPHVCPASFDAE